MKKFLALLMILCLFASLAGAEAEKTVEENGLPVIETVVNRPKWTQIEAENTYSVRYSTTAVPVPVLIRQEDENLTLVDSKLNPISDVYKSEMIVMGNTFKVTDGKARGLIDGRSGELLIPCIYDEIEVFNATTLDKDQYWYLGVYLENGTEKDSDYRDANNQNKYYKITTSDLYHGKEKIATLTRDQYSSKSSVFMHGKYIWLRSKETGNYTIYDWQFQPVKENMDSASEFVTDYVNDSITYAPTGEPAFTEGCTLKAEDVEDYYMVKDGAVIDLQGKVAVQPETEYKIVYAPQAGDHFVMVSNDYYGQYGLIDMKGHEVIPCVCDEILMSYARDGYIPVKINGKIAWYDETGKLIDQPELTADGIHAEGPIAYRWEDGRALVYIAGLGRLPDVYSRVDIAGNLIMAETMDRETYESHICLVNAKGETLIPYEDNWQSIEITDDGSLVLARDQDWNYQIAVFPQK